MAITDMKDVKKLQKRLKSALDELKYIKKCCEDAGRELEKNSFKWDSKEKNLVIQALDLNEKYSCSLTRIMELEKENEALKAQKDTFASLMNIYKDISKGRQDSKIVADYINKLEQKLQIAEEALGFISTGVKMVEGHNMPVPTRAACKAFEALQKMKEIK